MATLARGDAERLLRFVSVADELATEEPVVPETLTEFGRLVEADLVGYWELDLVRRQVRCEVLRPGDQDTPEWEPDLADAWDLIATQHPLCARHHRGEIGALKLSDCWTLRELRRTRTYELLCRPWGIEHSLTVAIPSPLWRTMGFAFERRSGDFGERDRRVLDLLQPHLVRIWRAARTRRVLASALRGLDQAPEGESRGVVVVRPPSQLEYASPPARRLLREFFPTRSDGLPGELVSWLDGAAEPLVVARGDRVLRIERSGDALLLEASLADVRLTRREQEVLGWVARGKTNAQVAEVLWLSPGTVRKHLENAYAKLGVRTRTAAVARFLALADAAEDQPTRPAQSS